MVRCFVGVGMCAGCAFYGLFLFVLSGGRFICGSLVEFQTAHVFVFGRNETKCY